MESITELVNDHPFDMELQCVFLKYMADTAGQKDLNAARSLSSEFVDLDDAHWKNWVNSSKEISTPDELAGLISAAFNDHPSPAVLAECIGALSILIKSHWNEWTIFTKRPTAEKSAIRFMEQALDKVSLWPDSAIAWKSARELLKSLGTEKESVRKLYLRQLQAVPMNSETRSALIAEQKEYEKTVGLSHIEADTSGSERSWRSWSALEESVSVNPGFFHEMITKRSSVDTPEMIASLYARSVMASRADANTWIRYWEYARDTLKNERMQIQILRRAVKNCPYCGELWVNLVKVAESTSSPDTERIVMMGSSALRDSMMGNEESLQVLLLVDAKLKLAQEDVDGARESFSNAVSILSEMGPKLAISAFIAWVHAELFQPLLMQADGVGIAAELVKNFTSNPEWEDKRVACAPLQWVHLAWLKRMMADCAGVRDMYDMALKYVDERYKSIILQDQVVFEQSLGSIGEFVNASERMHAIESTKRKVPEKPVAAPTKKKARSEEHSAMIVDEQTLLPVAEVSKPAPVAPKTFPKCVYIKDLAFSVDDEKLCGFFESSIGSRPVKTAIVMNSIGRSRGFGYAEFDSEESANKAVECSGQQIDGRAVSVSISNRPISVKKQESPPPPQIEEEKVKTNDYFRNLIAQKQKLSHR